MPPIYDLNDTPLPQDYFERKYGTSRTTFWRYRNAGLETIKVGAKIFARESHFIAFLERMNGKTVSATPLISKEVV